MEKTPYRLIILVISFAFIVLCWGSTSAVTDRTNITPLQGNAPLNIVFSDIIRKYSDGYITANHGLSPLDIIGEQTILFDTHDSLSGNFLVYAISGDNDKAGECIEKILITIC
ncbi:MAG: hypothetical protein GXY48_05745 [Methanomicrobiales archaeon]|nr:hypothetical protein [Methanomicrobiales archaeon]